MGKCGSNATEAKEPSNYITIDGKTVPVTDEQKKAWYEMANAARKYARRFGTCGQPDFRKCCGDCTLCAFQREGAFIYSDDRQRFADGFSEGKLAPMAPAPTPEEQVENADMWRWLYEEADTIVKCGRDILSLRLEEGLSERKIGERLDIPWPTVHSRLNTLLDFIRAHREELI